MIRRTIKQAAVSIALIASIASPLSAQDLADEIIGYMDFATYDAGIILPEQLTEDIWDALYFVDTRDAAQFNAGSIPGAVHIEWREIPARLDELPADKKVVLYCNTGTLSAQATFAARLMGHENVVVLQSGFDGWQANAAYQPE